MYQITPKTPPSSTTAITNLIFRKRQTVEGVETCDWSR